MRSGQIDTFSYDAAGQLLSHTWYASDDTNGSKGLLATPTGAESSTVWTYNSQGWVEKATDTLNGVAMGEWTFSYDSAGQTLKGAQFVTDTQRRQVRIPLHGSISAAARSSMPEMTRRPEAMLSEFPETQGVGLREVSEVSQGLGFRPLKTRLP